MLHFATDLSMPLLSLSPEVEARDLDAIFLGEHTNIPVSRVSPFPSGEAMPERYKRLMDPFIALAQVAAVSGLTIGTAVCLPALHDAIALSKTIATLDHLSDGRLICGVGLGWNREEAASHGLDPRDRRRVLREKVLAMKEIWGNEEAAFHGEYVSFDRLWSYPKPVSKPNPPVLLGAPLSAATLADIFEWGDGWLDVGTPGYGKRIASFRQAASDAGRDPSSLATAVTGAAPSAGQLARLRQLDVDWLIVRLPDTGRDDILRTLDTITESLSREAAVS